MKSIEVTKVPIQGMAHSNASILGMKVAIFPLRYLEMHTKGVSGRSWAIANRESQPQPRAN
jgi:hypothetical protein